ncbi:protein kinase-like domain-containing protein [Artemisia annua]|uniref:non-specific serine/threonine protein kinase n=1 Tax=Artemisia annua TaxID=35608 RepID=A0A2U1QLB2_ARTAN|nr:protein kinase-like domain-containing protein [Artemisia annua]QGV13663.1 UDP-glucose hydroxylase [Artemisia annua]
MVEEVWGNGVKAMADNDGVVTRDEIKRCLKVVMSDGEIKSKCEILKSLANEAMVEGGSSHTNLKQLLETNSPRPNTASNPSMPVEHETGDVINWLLARFFIFLTAAVTVTADDGAVMTKLSAALKNTPPSWSSNTDYCKWEGITCDNSNRVTAINLVDKALSGTLVPELNDLSSLKTLAVQRNHISGDIPYLSSLNQLQQVILDGNNFTSFPGGSFFVGLTGLQVFSVSDNHDLAQWALPDNLTDVTNLQSFQASNANIVGTIPDIFAGLTNLQSLRLSYNNLTGGLPRSFGGSSIQNLWLNNQKQGLSGGLGVVSEMLQVSQVWLQANSFVGAIPDLSNCSALFDLQLRDNQLTGLVPKSLVSSLPKLANVTLQNNKLQGPVPVFKSDVKVDKYQASNSFCLTEPGPCDPQVSVLLDVAGAIGYPMSLAQSWTGNDACKLSYVNCDNSGNVTTVNFAKRMFSGTISPAFANLTSLRTLSLNDNNFVGTIPKELTTLPNLQTLDVSNNNLSGDMPDFPPRVKFTFGGNPNIGKDVSNTSGSGSGSGNAGGGNQKPVKVEDPESGKEIVKASAIGGSSNAHKVGTELQSQGSSDHAAMHVFEGGNVIISIDVLRQVTDNFSEENILGRGGFGVVYKGELHDGTKIAVKRMEAGVMGTKGLKEFQAEIAVLTKVRHRHLVALLGYCVNGNERLLVYEYMPQGTLSQHLFECRELKTNPLSWKQRVSIALDVGRGVEYLHSLAQQSFIHRDLKPSNILLGDDMRAKVADFGLVKNAPDRDGKFSVETRLAGTFGYLAPEYAATGRVTTKVDVYAFGVVLMELITGRKALD